MRSATARGRVIALPRARLLSQTERQQVADLPARERLEQIVQALVDLLDELDAPAEDMEDGDPAEDDGNSEESEVAL